MNSRKGITLLGSDLDTYLDSNYTGGVPIMDTEYDKRDEDSLAGDYSIPGVRIGLYELPEEVTARTGDGKVLDSLLRFQLQLFFNIARIGDYDVNVEFEMLDIKDLIYNWTYQIDAPFVSEYFVKTFNYDQLTRITRQDEYAIMEINLNGRIGDVQPIDAGIGYMIIEKTFEVA